MVIIDPYRGGEDTGYNYNNIIEKDFNLAISDYIYNRLKELGVDVIKTRNNDVYLSDIDRANSINKYPNSIGISNRLNYGDENGVEILYSLRNSNALSNKIKDSFENNDIYVNKVYQKRDENDTSLDSDNLLKNINNKETIIIYYGYINKDNINIEEYAESVVEGIASYLNIPYTYEKENVYIVKKGDTLYSIAKKYNTTVDNLKSVNNLNSNLLSIGQKLKIPSKDETYYIVKSGDTLYKISRLYNVPVDDIKKANNLTSNIISINQKLLIPSNVSNNTIYLVQKGDTLYSIAKRFNTTVFEIKSINNLSSNLLSINQRLLIPN